MVVLFLKVPADFTRHTSLDVDEASVLTNLFNLTN